MYISRVQIDFNNRRKMKNLSHLGAYHSWVEDSFPKEQGKERSRKLWRIDELYGKKYLLIVSPDRPDLKALEKFGLDGTAETKSYDKYLASIKKGDQLRFRVTLNPVVSRKEEGRKRGRVYPILNTKDQLEFLQDRSIKNGFSLSPNSFTVVDRAFVPLRKHGKKLVDLSKVSYEGSLQVEDEDIFYKTLTKGFGKKKAYGCGLMTVIKK